MKSGLWRNGVEYQCSEWSPELKQLRMIISLSPESKAHLSKKCIQAIVKNCNKYELT